MSKKRNQPKKKARKVSANGKTFMEGVSVNVLDDILFSVMKNPELLHTITKRRFGDLTPKIIGLLTEFWQAKSEEAGPMVEDAFEATYIDKSAALLYLKASFAFRCRHYEKAKIYSQRALKIRPKSYPIIHMLGSIAQNLSQNNEAIKLYELALEIKPDNYVSRMNLAMLRSNLCDNETALEHLEDIAANYPNKPIVMHNYGLVLVRSGNFLKASNAYEKNIFPEMKLINSVSGYYYNCLFALDEMTEPVSEKHKKIGKHASKTFPEQPFQERKCRRKKLKVGYLSGDFRRHSCAFFLEPIIRNHTDSFETHCLSLTTAKDKVTEHFINLCDQFHHLESLGDNELFEAVRHLDLDILIDAIGHTTDTRVPLLLKKGSPVQINYLGFARSSFLPTMDYRIVDNITDPIDSIYYGTEKLLHMPSSFLCFKPLLGAPDVGPAPFLENGYITFGSLNNTQKISEHCWKMWSDILSRVPDAKLLLKSFDLKTDKARQKVRDVAKSFNISSSQLILKEPQASYDEHLGSYNEIDIALDTFPYTGTTTTCEALLMGTAVVSLAGSEHLARVGKSIMSQVGLSQMVSDAPESYIDKAVFLAHQKELIVSLKKTTRARLLKSPLCDEKSFIDSFEKLLRMAYQGTGEVVTSAMAS